MAKVRALTEKAKKLWHVPSGMRFDPNTGLGDWPLDQFTKRRIRDGDIELVEEKEAKRETTRRTASRSEV